MNILFIYLFTATQCAIIFRVHYICGIGYKLEVNNKNETCKIQLYVSNERKYVFLQSIAAGLLETLTAIAETVMFPYRNLHIRTVHLDTIKVYY